MAGGPGCGCWLPELHTASVRSYLIVASLLVAFCVQLMNCGYLVNAGIAEVVIDSKQKSDLPPVG